MYAWYTNLFDDLTRHSQAKAGIPTTTRVGMVGTSHFNTGSNFCPWIIYYITDQCKYWQFSCFRSGLAGQWSSVRKQNGVDDRPELKCRGIRHRLRQRKRFAVQDHFHRWWRRPFVGACRRSQPVDEHDTRWNIAQTAHNVILLYLRVPRSAT